MAKQFSLLALGGVLILWMIPQSAAAQDEVRGGDVVENMHFSVICIFKTAACFAG